MDQTLPAKTQPIRTFGYSCNPVRSTCTVILVAFSCFVLLQSGCQTGGFAKLDKAIPVPPPVLDADSVDNYRFQSPDSFGGSGSRSNGSGARSSPSQPKTAKPRVDVFTPPVDPNTGKVDPSHLVADVIVEGNQTIPAHQLRASIQTRTGRYFDPDKLQQDIDKLWRMPEISRINGPYLKRTAEGVIVTIEIVERNTIQTVEFLGNRGIPDRTLKKEVGFEDGSPLDVHAIRSAKTKIEEFYKEKGYPRTQVEILEGNEKDHSKVVFLIHEDEKQRIWKVEFEGNEIATDARLRHFIQSKPGVLKVFGGLVKRDEIDQDITRLTTYYRNLGFFNARIGREVGESNDGRWLTLRFIIDEGPRYRVRNISFIGNHAYTAEQLAGILELKPTSQSVQPEFNVSKMNLDVVSLRDLYGSQGFVYSQVEAEPRFLEEPGLLDIVYKIEEGKQYVVGKINVHFEGDVAVTKINVPLNRISLRPGDLIDVREIRNSERRLASSGLFGGQQTGDRNPSVVVSTPEVKDLQRSAKNSGGSSHR